MSDHNERYEFIKGEVVAILENCNIRCIPISGYDLANKLGIRLMPYSELKAKQFMAAMKISSDGFYVEDALGNDIIYFNDSVAYKRRNMTILHEIGHCVLDHKGESDVEEMEANFFAKYAAASPPLIHFLSTKSPKSIEDTFRISHKAAVYAYSYYQKWMKYGGEFYKDYEIRLLRLFLAV